MVDAVYICVDGDNEDGGSEETASFQFKRLRAVYFPSSEEELAYSQSELSSEKLWVKKSTGEKVISERAIRIGVLPGIAAMTPPEKWREGE